MSVNTPYYPTTIWDGTTPTRSLRSDNKAPDYEDFDQLVAEIIALQTEHRDYLDLINNTGVTSVIGAPVYVDANSKAVYADGNGSGTRLVIGLIAEAGVAIAASMRVKYRGKITLTAAQWDVVAGTTGGLTPGTAYYLSDTVGLMGAAPSTSGDTVMRVIIALTATTALIEREFEKTA